MRINDYVYVTKPDSLLYRRRCRITAIEENDKYVVYSEGMEEEEILEFKDFIASEY